MSPVIRVLRRRADFVAAAKSGVRYVKPSVVIQCRKCQVQENEPAVIRVGFTATKTVGNAVIRNRVKRRLRAAIAQLMPVLGVPGYDYVCIGREQTYKGTFSDLIRDMKHALKRLAEIAAKSETPTHT